MKSGTSLLYQIPLGQGHKLLPDGAAGKIFGGWQLALVNAYNSGSRLAATVPNTLLFFNGGLRPTSSRATSGGTSRCRTSIRLDTST